MTSNRLIDLGFKNSKAHTNMFLRKARSDLIEVLIYVNDILLTSSNEKFLDELVSTLNNKFALKFLDDVHYFLSLEICITPFILQLYQQKYVKYLLIKFGLEASRLPKLL